MTTNYVMISAWTVIALAWLGSLAATLRMMDRVTRITGRLDEALRVSEKERTKLRAEVKTLQTHCFSFFRKHRQAVLTVREYGKVQAGEPGVVQERYGIIPQDQLKSAVVAGLKELQRRRLEQSEAARTAEEAAAADACSINVNQAEACSAETCCQVPAAADSAADEAADEVVPVPAPRPTFKPKAEYYKPSTNGYYKKNPAGADV